ncbi:MAG: class I SAM-dependent rRNA methyltransferase [Gammaproteobacteria bacterium]|nr:class I SAM-dependent rRNA methyltransferase [Gammaproteobacteria bacterium]
MYLNKGQERRITAGHLWIFSNEIDQQKSPLKGFSAGEYAILLSYSGKPLGLVYVNPHSLICARLVSRKTDLEFNHSFIKHRINVALSLREKVFKKPFYRLIYGESDFLPGLVVDRYGDNFVVQITTAGIEAVKDDVVYALKKIFNPHLILFRNDTNSRVLENLEQYNEIAFSSQGLNSSTDSIIVDLIENDCHFSIDVLNGQKTGWFYDHRMNRQSLQKYVKDKTVLDLFSYVGGWGVAMAKAKASEVTCVDSSAHALSKAQDNANLNHCQNLATIENDAFEFLKNCRAERRKFDVVIVDPPAFIKRKKDLKKGTQAYFQLNKMAMQVCNKDAILVSASCSHHLAKPELIKILTQSSGHIDRDLQIIETGQQGPDHPIHPAIPETEYIKSYTARVLIR